MRSLSRLLRPVPLGIALLVVLLCVAFFVFSARRRETTAPVPEVQNSTPAQPEAWKREPQKIATYKLDAANAGRDGDVQECRRGQVTLNYSAKDFQTCALRSRDKRTFEPGLEKVLEAPAHTSISLIGVPLSDGSGRSELSDNRIDILPLADPSVPDYGKAYPTIDDNARRLRDLLKRRPQMTQGSSTAELPDLTLFDEGHDFYGKIYFVDLPSLEGISYLTRYSKDPAEALLSNADLIFVFQGLTRDGRFYISAHFPIVHASLPRNDFQAREISRPGKAYLEQAPKRLDGLPDDSFQPSLPRLWGVLGALSVNESP